MKAKAAAGARQVLEYAREEASLCVTDAGHRALVKHWITFLMFAHQFFNKLRAGTKKDEPSRTWFEGIERTREDDGLLRYIHHTRNSADHGAQEVTARVPAVVLGYAIGPGAVRRLAAPVGTLMVPVWDKRAKRRYDPPRTHLGQPINIPTPNLNHLPTFLALESGAMPNPEPFRDIANLAVAFMEKTLAEAAGFVRE